MLNLLKKIPAHFRRVRNASRLGIRFHRRASFQIPSRIQLNSKFLDIYSNRDHGARIDFLMCLIEDGYGLEDLKLKPSNILDIGANQGFFALAARGFFPNATLHCYEPNLRILPVLEKNADVSRSVIFREAVGGMEGTVFLEESGDSNQSRTNHSAHGIPVPQVSLQTAVERLGGRVDLAKIDCEGAEWEMLENPEPWQSIRELRMEYHLLDQYDYAEIVHRLKTLGFRIFKHFPEGEWGTIWATSSDHFP
jgi:FkbM family methyltransferase